MGTAAEAAHENEFKTLAVPSCVTVGGRSAKHPASWK